MPTVESDNSVVRSWLLSAAAEPMGFIPHAKKTVDLLRQLENEGLVRQSNEWPVWHITDRGRSVLKSTVDTWVEIIRGWKDKK